MVIIRIGIHRRQVFREAGASFGLGGGLRAGKTSNLAAGIVALASLGLLGGCESFELPKMADMPWNKPAAQETQDVTVGRQERKAAVRHAQRLLAELGYRPGPSDGVAGAKTRRAVRKYQKDIGQTADGRVTAALLRRLEASVKNAKEQKPKRSPQKDQSAGTSPKSAVGGPPAYEAGNTFVYSDGRVDTVVGLKGDMVRWQRNDGTKFTANRNFLLPWAYWQSQSESGTQTLDGETRDLWPRAAGQEVSFSVESVLQTGDSGALMKSTERWRCRLAGERRVTVMAGSFDTWKLICDRAAGKSVPALQRVWYYAPKIQHFVRLEDRGQAGGDSSEVELVTIRPGGEGWPPIARAALSRAVEKALETVSNGREAPWRSSGVDTRVSIKPTSRFESGDGRVCRTFLQTWSGKEGKRSYPGAACRDDSGRWRIPGLEDGSDETLAVSEGLS